MNDRNGLPASGMTGFGSVSVSGRRRVPSPPARTSACMSAADALVHVPRAAEQLAVEEVAAVDDERIGHPPLDLAGPVELAELRPLGDEHRGLGAVERVERRRGDDGCTEDLARADARDRVVDA